MIISKTGAVKALKEAYKKGYEIVPGADDVTICTAKWSAVANLRQLPVEVSQQLVEHMGYIPTHPELVRKGAANQAVLREVSQYRLETLKKLEDEATRMYPAPIIFKNRWQLFVTPTQGVFAFDIEILSIVSPDAYAETFVTAYGIGVWKCVEELVMIAPGVFDPEDQKKLRRIAELYAQPRTMPEDEPENLSMFDDLGGDEE